MAVTQGYKGSIRGQTDVAAAFTDEACTDISPVGEEFTVFQITDASLRFWDTAGTFVVEVDTGGGFVAADEGDYTLQHLGGKITFAVALADGDLVQVTGVAYPMAEFAGFQKWEAEIERAELETTQLSATATGARSYMMGLTKAAISTEGFYVDSYFFDKISGNGLVVVSLLIGNGGHYDCYTYLNKLGPSVAVDDLVLESRDFTVTGQFFFSAS